MNRRDLLVSSSAAAASFAGAAIPLPAFAQSKYPDRPIKLVVPFVAGGVFDAIARVWVERIKDPLGTFYIENIGGAGGTLGGIAAAHAQPDGYTILLGGVGTLVINAIAMSKPPYDPVKDFEGISMVAIMAMTIAVHPSVPVHTLQEFIAYAKANPGKLSYGSAGTGSLTHLGAEMFKSKAGTPDIVHVPYKGSGASITDAVSGQVQMIVANVTGHVLELHRTGKLRMLAVTSPERVTAAPDIPTAVECGLPGMVAVNFAGLYAPAGTPKPIVEQVAAANAKTMADPLMRKSLIDQGIEPVAKSTPESTLRYIAEDIARWTPVIRSIGLKLN